MTISRKARMLHIIEQLENYTGQMSEDVKTNLLQAKEKLETLQEEDVEQLTDKVVSRPATELAINLQTPENLLHSCYDELERLAQSNTAPSHLQEAVQEMRYYFSIEEQDGFFP
ncbi:hypothetical protein H1D32_17935 [Anaerobacillus sp. CMMVII]|uniref:hypothetical protein n=1 Tax=Anaerobacillus sp. CMMVII TaxID=2755588 RepID=UPI0021B787D5|nr:hypothetical protein [Anaerobacillus sp. CMMVII]MCT8139416.1 hypothetical protein [Anaerobacillus sp. CMMVII]